IMVDTAPVVIAKGRASCGSVVAMNLGHERAEAIFKKGMSRERARQTWLPWVTTENNDAAGSCATRGSRRRRGPRPPSPSSSERAERFMADSNRNVKIVAVTLALLLLLGGTTIVVTNNDDDDKDPPDGGKCPKGFRWSLHDRRCIPIHPGNIDP